MSDTPRTDAEAEWVRPMGKDSAPPHEQHVSIEFARELERENAALARWIVYHSDHTSGDHACAECYPHGEAVKSGFRCAVHIARSIDATRKEAQP